MTTTVTTQKELDAALKGSDDEIIIINSPAGVWLELGSHDKYVSAFGSASVRAFDSASVSASGSASVSAFGSASVRAFGSASVSAFDSASVRAFGSASVRAFGSASVSAFGSASVRAFDSASVRAFDSASVRASGSASVRASDYVSVHLHSKRVKHHGGVIIDVTDLDRSGLDTWADYHGTEVIDGEVIVYKAVDQHLKSARGFAYPIGDTVTCPDWKAGDFCGNGLHLSPSPTHAQYYYEEATRFLKCAVPINDLTIIDGNGGSAPKLKARTVRVLAEVDVHGRELS